MLIIFVTHVQKTVNLLVRRVALEIHFVCCKSNMSVSFSHKHSLTSEHLKMLTF